MDLGIVKSYLFPHRSGVEKKIQEGDGMGFHSFPFSPRQELGNAGSGSLLPEAELTSLPGAHAFTQKHLLGLSLKCLPQAHGSEGLVDGVLGRGGRRGGGQNLWDIGSS